MSPAISQVLSSTILAVNAMDRFRAVGGKLGGAGMGAWLMLAMGMLVLGGVLTFFALAHRRDHSKELWQRFRRRAERLGLSEEESALLRNIAIGARIKEPETIFASEDAFFRGMAGVDRGAEETGLFGGTRMAVCGSCRYYQSLREKLGFIAGRPTPSESAGVSLGPIEPGTILKVVRQRAPHDMEVILEGVDANTGELMIGKSQDLPVRHGEAWSIHYPDEGLLWEFSARVVAVRSETEIVVKPLGDARHSNRRQFHRVPISQPAQVAPFPFATDNATAEPPRFVQAEIVELGGTGVLIEADIDAKTDDRVLVVLELDNKRVEGLGLVRRGRGDDGEDRTIAIELVGLNTAQVAQLAKETNAFATAGVRDRSGQAEGSRREERSNG